jgi:predicted lipoprotein with Yx(FWY)xxD motif
VIRARTIALLAASVALPVAALSACGGENDHAAASATTVAEASSGGLGEILVDSRARTIYPFEKDAGPTSSCAGNCAIDWPPVTTTGRPTAGGGLSATDIGTTKRSDGTTQVTYNGHPLYRFQGDRGPGEANGQGLNAFGAAWYVVSPAGNEITAAVTRHGYTGGGR